MAKKAGGKSLDLTGHEYDNWIVLQYCGRQKRNTMWWCKCKKCGHVQACATSNLRSGRTTQCRECATNEKAIPVTIDGVTRTVKEWARRTGISYKVLYDRFKTMPPEDAIRKNLPHKELALGKKIKFNGCSLNITQWAKKLQMSRVTLYRRLKSLPIEQALQPLNKKK